MCIRDRCRYVWHPDLVVILLQESDARFRTSARTRLVYTMENGETAVSYTHLEQACAVFSALKFLFEPPVVYKVQVYLFGKVEYGTFNKVSRVERHIQVSVETERLGIKRRESKV